MLIRVYTLFKTDTCFDSHYMTQHIPFLIKLVIKMNKSSSRDLPVRCDFQQMKLETYRFKLMAKKFFNHAV